MICNHTTDKGAMNWDDIADMKKDGMDIESHTMTHPDLSTLSQKQLEFEIGGSKECLASHGYNATIFAYPYDDGSTKIENDVPAIEMSNINSSGVGATGKDDRADYTDKSDPIREKDCIWCIIIYYCY